MSSRTARFLGWARPYDRARLRGDVLAGLTTAVMLVPQAMAYAALAGMPPVTGLYAAIVPLVVYALLGTSGSLAFGPVAIVALLTNAAVAPLANGDPGTYVALAGTLALMVGVIQLLLGLLRLGSLTNYVSHSVISGFTSAAALVIAASQFRSLLGIDAERGHTFLEAVGNVLASLDQTHVATLVLAAVSVTVLFVGRRISKRFPTPLVVVVGVTAVVAALGLGDRGVAILREVPSGIPTPTLPSFAASDLADLVPAALTIALLSYMESISVAKAIAAKTGDPLDPSRELVASGAANLTAGVFRAFPVAGGFGRTAVNYEAGARTPLASLITAAVLAVSVAVLTPLFYNIPKAVLAAVIVVAVSSLVDVAAAREAWRVSRSDFATLAVTFLATLLIGVEPGIGLGVGFSLLVFVRRSAYPHTAELGRVEGTDTYRNVERYPTVTDPRVAILRVDGPLFFANARYVEDRVDRLCRECRHELEVLVLDAAAVTDVDVDAIETIEHLDERLHDAGIALHLATVRGPVRDRLDRAGVWAQFAPRTHASVPQALEAAGLAAGLAAAPEPEGAPVEVY